MLNTALNAGIFLIASLAIQGIVKALDNYIHRVEKARERTSDLFDEFKSMNDALADHKKTVSELADRYDELSKGVNLSTNTNVSLSTEEYEEFLDINEQLANSFPELAKGIDENGNSILTLGTKGITAKEELEDLLKTEEDLNNFRIAQNLGDAFTGVVTYVEEANEATDKLNGSINDSSEAMSKLQEVAENGIKLSGDYNQFLFAGNINNQAEIDYMNSLTDSINEFWKSLDGSRRVELGIDSSDLFTQKFDESTGAFELYFNAYSLTQEELTTLENIIQDNVGDVSGALLDSISEQSQELQNQIQQGENAWRDFIPNLIAGMKSKQTFKDLDSDLQNIAVQIVEGLDYSYATAMQEWNPDDPYAYIRDNIIVPMSDLGDSDRQRIKSAFTELMKLDAEDISKSNQDKISKLISTIATLLEKDPLEISVALGFDVEDIQNRYNEALKEAKNQLGGYGHDDRGFEVNNAIGDKLDNFWNENVVTEEDLTLWKKVADGITEATVAMDAYTEAKKNANEVEVNETPVLFAQFTKSQESLDKLQSSIKSAQDAYTTLLSGNYSTSELLSSIQAINQAVSDMGGSLNWEFIKSQKDSLDLLGDAIEHISQKYAESILSGAGIDVNSEFGQMLANIIQEAYEVEAAFEGMNSQLDNLQSSYQTLTGILESYNETGYISLDNLQSLLTADENLIQMLEVENGQLVLNQEAYENLVAVQLMEFKAKLDSAAAAEIEELAKQKAEEATNNNATASNNAVEKIDAETAALNRNAAAALGDATAKAAINAQEAGVSEEDIQSIVNKYTEVWNAAVNNYKGDFSGFMGVAKKAGKDAGKSLKDGLKEELSDLDSVISGITKSIDKQISSINEQKSVVLDAIDAQIDALEEERDARLAVIEAQKKQLEQNIKALEKQIKAKQKEADAIQKAADNRAREITLQEKQYELEKMQNMRTKLVK